MSKKLKVLFSGEPLVIAGYGVHSRQIVRWLESRSDIFDVKYRILPWGSCAWMINPEMEDGLIGRVMAKSNVQQSDQFDLAISLQLPNEWTPKIGTKNIGMTAGAETDLCNPEWVAACNKMDLVIVPSEHSKKTFENTAVKANMQLTTKIIVVPEAFFDEILLDDLPKLDLKLETSFNFLMFGQITSNSETGDRKNTYKTLKWICETFRKDKDVGIILKTNCAKGTTYDRSMTENLLKNYLANFRSESIPKIYLVHGDMNNKETAALYREPTLKGFINFGFGEGYGLPLLEAAASDVPILATNWSGHLDFLNKGKFIKIDYDLVEVDSSKIDGKIFVKGARWAHPKELSAKKALKKFRESPDIPKQWAKELGEIIRSELSQEQINKKYDIVCSEFIEKWFGLS